MVIKKIIFACALIAPTMSFAQEQPSALSLSLYETMKVAPEVDCKNNVDICNFWAATEVVATANVCIAMHYLNKDLNSESAKDLANFNDHLNKWSYIANPQVKDAVLSPRNLLRLNVEEQIKSFLSTLSPGDVLSECQRMSPILDNSDPKPFSEIVSRTKNFNN